MENEQRFFSVKEAAELLRVSLYFIREYIKRGDIKAVKLGKAYMIDREELERFIKTLEVYKRA